MLKSDEINEISKALVKAQSEMGSAKKDSDNPFFKSKYADLSEIIKVIKEPLNNNKITFLQPIEDGMIKTLLIHESGQWIQSGGTNIIADKQTAQSQGSGITYARRYDLQSMLTIPAEDDDGQGAMPQNKQPTKAKPTKPKAEPKSTPPLKDYQQTAVDKLMGFFKGDGIEIKKYISGFIGEKASYELSSCDCDCIIDDINNKDN